MFISRKLYVGGSHILLSLAINLVSNIEFNITYCAVTVNDYSSSPLSVIPRFKVHRVKAGSLSDNLIFSSIGNISTEVSLGEATIIQVRFQTNNALAIVLSHII